MMSNISEPAKKYKMKLKEKYYIIFKEKSTKNYWCFFDGGKHYTDTPTIYYSYNETTAAIKKLAEKNPDTNFSYFKFDENNKYIEIHTMSLISGNCFYIPYRHLKFETKESAHNHFIGTTLFNPKNWIQIRDKDLNIIYCWCDMCKPEK